MILSRIRILDHFSPSPSRNRDFRRFISISHTVIGWFLRRNDCTPTS